MGLAGHHPTAASQSSQRCSHIHLALAGLSRCKIPCSGTQITAPLSTQVKSTCVFHQLLLVSHTARLQNWGTG